jgi:hypothetical protein
MFARRIRLCKLLRFEVRIDWSWIIIALLIAWSLSKGLSPSYYKNLSTQTYWWMGIIGTVGLFLSVIVHEFSLPRGKEIRCAHEGNHPLYLWRCCRNG